jgi:hypothetical protein
MQKTQPGENPKSKPEGMGSRDSPSLLVVVNWAGSKHPKSSRSSLSRLPTQQQIHYFLSVAKVRAFETLERVGKID